MVILFVVFTVFITTLLIHVYLTLHLILHLSITNVFESNLLLSYNYSSSKSWTIYAIIL